MLTDNGPCYISNDLKDFLEAKNIVHIKGKPFHPQTQGKIERYHRTMKNVIKLEHYYSPDQLRQRIGEFVDYYNHYRYHESLNNMTPADVYFGRAQEVQTRRDNIKQRTLMKRRINSELTRLL